MNSLSIIVFCVALVAATAAPSHLGLGVGLVGPGNPGALVKGPAVHAAVHGPDGSAVAGAADAGAVAAAPIPGGHVAAAVAPGHVAIGHGGVWGGPVGLGWGGWGHGGAALVAPSAVAAVAPGWGGHWGGGWGHGHGW